MQRERNSDPFTLDRLEGYTKARKGGVVGMFRGSGCWILGFCGIALGAGILIAAIFPVGALMILVAFLLIACGCTCCRRR